MSGVVNVGVVNVAQSKTFLFLCVQDINTPVVKTI